MSDDGSEHRILEYTGMTGFTPLGSDSMKSMATGMKRYCTPDGRACNRVDDQTFEIVALGLRVKRDNA